MEERAKLESTAIPVIFTVEQITPQISGLKQSCITHKDSVGQSFGKSPEGLASVCSTTMMSSTGKTLRLGETPWRGLESSEDVWNHMPGV